MKRLLEKMRLSIKEHLNMWYMLTVGIIFLTFLVFLYLLQDRGKFVFNEHLEDTAITVESRDITLKDAAYYIMVIESNVNGFALRYNAGDPKRYWNIYMNDGGDRSNFLSQQAKEDAIASCIRDEIYYREALEAGVSLSSEEKSQVMDDAYEQEKLMTGKMLEVTEYDYKDLYNILNKIAIVKKYVNTLMEGGYTEKELDVEGSYYENLKGNYEIWENEELWEDISLGSVTIN